MPTPIAFPPNITPDTQEFGIRYNTQVSSTSLSGIVQTVELPGARWFGSMSFRDLTTADSATLKAWLLELRGSSGRFYFGDLELTSSQGTISGSPIVTGGTARQIVISGHSGSLAVGDRISIYNDAQTEREYKMIIEVVNSTTYKIEPMLRMPIADADDVIYGPTPKPTGVFMLDADDHAKWSIRSKAKLSDIAFSFVEAFT